MKKYVSFKHGGVTLPRPCIDFSHVSLENAYLPVSAVVPLCQHSGEESRALVSVGDTVREGLLIGKSTGNEGSSVHSPIPGVVREIKTIICANSVSTKAVVIDLKGSFDKLGKKREYFPWKTLSWGEIVHILAERGVVSMDSKAIPLAPYFFSRREKTIKTLVIKAFDTDPYCENTDALLATRLDTIIEGMAILARLLKPTRIVFAIAQDDANDYKEKTKELCAKLELSFDVVKFSYKYPSDSDRQLYEVLHGECLSGLKSISDSDMSVFSCETLFALTEALIFNKPVIERLVTVSGDAIRFPKVLKVRIGTRIGDVIDECGGFIGNPERLVIGTAMQGFAVMDLDTPITKNTSQIIALTRAETRSTQVHSCMKCGRCKSVCPERLDPKILYKYLDHSSENEDFLRSAQENGLLECSECGACSFECPARIPLLQLIALYKNTLLRK